MKKEATESEINVIGKFEIITKTRNHSNEKKALRDWIEIINQDLEKFGWPGIEHLNNIEQQLLKRWNELLREVDRSHKAESKITLSFFLEQLINISEGTIFQPETINSLMSIMNYSEAIGMEFDYLWLSGLDNQQWPSTENKLSFISLEIQKKYNRKGLCTDFHPTNRSQQYAVIKQTQRVLNSFVWGFNSDLVNNIADSYMMINK